MKKIIAIAISCCVFLLLATSSSLAQTSYTYTTSWLTPTGIRQNTDTSKTPIISYSGYSNSFIGKDISYEPQYKYFKYRSYYESNGIGLGLPVDAIIDNVVMFVSFTGYKSNYTMKVVSLPATSTSRPSLNGDATNWSNIGSGSSLVPEITTTGNQSATINLKNIFQTLIDSSFSWFAIGFLCNQENTTGSHNSFNVQFQVTYRKAKYRFFVKNSFNAGRVNVEGKDTTSGSLFLWNDNTSHALGAIDQQSGDYYRIWNTNGNNQSNWQKQLPSQLPQNINGASNRNHMYTSLKSDSGSTLIADLKKICRVTFTQQTEFGNIISSSVDSLVELNGITFTLPSQRTINGIDYIFVRWTDGSQENPRTFTPTQHIYPTAIYKAHRASNHPSPTNGNGQQRIVQTKWNMYDQYGEYILVYESAGEIWTTSYNVASGTWTPEVRLSDGSGNNSAPSIYSRGQIIHPGNIGEWIWGDGIYVVWQKKIGTNSYDVYLTTRSGYTWNPTAFPLKVNESACTVTPIPIVSSQTCYDPQTNPPNKLMEFIAVMFRQNSTVLKKRMSRINKDYWVGWLTSQDLPITNFGTFSSNVSPPEEYYLNADMISLAYQKLNYSTSNVNLWTTACNNSFAWTTPIMVDASADRPLANLSWPSPQCWYGDLYYNLEITSPQVLRRNNKQYFAWKEVQSYESTLVQNKDSGKCYLVVER